MQIKFYKYNNLDICPNKLKSATNVETIDIDAPQIMQNLGISFLLDRAIEANIAEYWLKGIQYIAYVDYSTSGNNMYTYKLTIDNLATAWYNKCFDRYNMVARSNLGNKLIDNLPRSYVPTIQTENFSDAYSDALMSLSILNAKLVSPGSGSAWISASGIDTYIMTVAQWYEFQNKFVQLTSSSTTDPKYELSAKDFVPCIIGARLIDSNQINLNQYSTVNAIWVYSTSPTILVNEFIEMSSNIYKAPQKTASSNIYKRVNLTLRSPFTINEETAQGILTLDIRHIGQIQTPLSAIKESTITTVGYDVFSDVVGGTCMARLVINDSAVYDNIKVYGSLCETRPLAYDSSVTNWRLNDIKYTLYNTQAAMGVANIANAGQVGTAIGGNPIVGLATASMNIWNINSQLLSNRINLQMEELSVASSGSTITGSSGSDIYRSSAKNSVLTISYYPIINKSGYQDRFGKADMTSRNITQLTGPVQTINCIASMNNLNINIINIATQLCDNGIWIL